MNKAFATIHAQDSKDMLVILPGKYAATGTLSMAGQFTSNLADADVIRSSTGKRTTDWTRLEGVTTAIPENAASFSFIPYCLPGCVGKAFFDDMELATYDKPIVGHLLSSAYRNMADSGHIGFRVGLAVPKEFPPEKLKAEFSYETPDGSGKTVPAQGLSRSESRFALAAEELKPGRSVVAFRLRAPDGSVLGATWLLVVNAQDKADAAELTLSEEFSEVAAEFGPAAEKTGTRSMGISLAPNEPALYRIQQTGIQ